jgi:tetratricopeptide (TPR) repeat protein
MTKNKMPRWLSEGISVYEERQSNPTWGQSMNPKYRELILGEGLTPVGKLSAAFLTPKTDLDLQFAYYESYLVVDFLVDRFGMESLKGILLDLGKGVAINDAIAEHTVPIDEIEDDFAEYARDRAKKLGPDLDWKKPDPAKLLKADADWLADNSSNFYVLMREAAKALRERTWNEAKIPLGKLLNAYPDQTGPDNAYTLLAEVHRRLGETNAEIQVLTRLAALEADALDAYSRLMELESQAKNWGAVRTNAERYLAVNPLVPLPYRFLGQAAEAGGQGRVAIEAYETMLQLDPPDPAEAQYRLARLLFEAGDPTARRHVLQALEEAPRYRDALRLLMEIRRASQTQTKAATPTPELAKP